MKKILLLLTLVSFFMFSPGQKPKYDFWKITWNKKNILETGKSDETTNTRKINAIDLEKDYTLDIVYKEANPKKEKEWIRSFLIANESDAELWRMDSTRKVTITAPELRKLFGDKKKIKIYTIAVPSDPNLAARVRVRRVHLCTLELQ